MPDFPIQRKTNQLSICTFSPESLGAEIRTNTPSFSANTVWPSANLAIFIPVEIFNPITIAKMAVNNGSTVNGSLEVGIYTPNGNKVVSSGSAAQTGVSSIQIFDITDTLLNPGLYYMAMVSDSATATFAGWTVGSTTIVWRALGVYQQAAGFVLPTTAVFAAMAQTVIPIIGMTPKTTI